VIHVKPGRLGAIATALSTAGAGTTILVHPGTYREGLKWDANGLLIRKRGIVLRAVPGGRVRIRPRKGCNYGLLITASDVLVHGIELEGFLRAGVTVGSERGTIKNIILSKITVRAPRDGRFHDGIVSYQDFRSRGESVVDGLLMRNVAVYDAGLGISCNAGPCRWWWLENVKVRNAASGGWGADAIAVESGENVVMVNVEVQRSSADGIDIKAKKVLIRDSAVHHVGRNGIKLWSGGDVVNTKVHHLTGGEAFVFHDKGSYRVLNCVAAHICDKGRCYLSISGYDTRAPQRVEVSNSIFYRTYGALFFADKTRVELSRNIFFGIVNKTAVDARAKGRRVQIRTSGSPRVIEQLGLGRGNSWADPRFVDPDRGDFHLQPGSPAIDGGAVSRPFPRLDCSGRARVRGGAPDLGPHER
jgi:hypothetical protein